AEAEGVPVTRPTTTATPSSVAQPSTESTAVSVRVRLFVPRSSTTTGHPNRACAPKRKNFRPKARRAGTDRCAHTIHAQPISDPTAATRPGYAQPGQHDACGLARLR